MDRSSRNFGMGPKENSGDKDLIAHCGLQHHYDFFCKRSLPSSLSNTRYLRHLAGDTEIRKGYGAELNQPLQNSQHLRERTVRIQPFDLETLRCAFQLQDTAPIELLSADMGVLKNDQSRDKGKKCRRHKGKDGKKQCFQEKNGISDYAAPCSMQPHYDITKKDTAEEHKKRKQHHKDQSKDKSDYAAPCSMQPHYDITKKDMAEEHKKQKHHHKDQSKDKSNYAAPCGMQPHYDITKKDMAEEHKKQKHHHKDQSKDKNKDKNGRHVSGNNHPKQHHDKKRKNEGNKDTENRMHKKRKRESSKIDGFGMIKVAS